MSDDKKVEESGQYDNFMDHMGETIAMPKIIKNIVI